MAIHRRVGSAVSGCPDRSRDLLSDGRKKDSHRRRYVLLADFTNGTGDPLFDNTLKIGLNVALTESPFVNLLSSDRVSALSKQMGLPSNANLTAGLARELCQRAGSKMYVAGSIGSADGKYVVALNAVNCQSGKTAAREQIDGSTRADEAFGRSHHHR